MRWLLPSVLGLMAVILYYGTVSCQTNKPKNLKILKDKNMTVEEIKEYMRNFTLGIGVECEYCHNEDDYSSDEKEKKVYTRDMILLVERLNEVEAFRKNGKVITCYTCHRGAVEINGTPPGL